jgi:hypothetical protein
MFTGLLGLAAMHPRLRSHRRVLVLCGAAYLAHIFCDLITGGVPLLAPIDPRIRGDAWLPFRSWFVFDGVLLAHAYLVHRWFPLRRRLRRGQRRPGVVSRSPAGRSGAPIYFEDSD